MIDFVVKNTPFIFEEKEVVEGNIAGLPISGGIPGNRLESETFFAVVDGESIELFVFSDEIDHDTWFIGYASTGEPLGFSENGLSFEECEGKVFLLKKTV